MLLEKEEECFIINSNEMLLPYKLEVKNHCLSPELHRLFMRICFYPTETEDRKKEKSGVGSKRLHLLILVSNSLTIGRHFIHL